MSTDDRSIWMQSAVWARTCATALGALVWFSVVLQFYLTLMRSIADGLTVWVGITRYFGYFTILTNILVGLVLTMPLLLPNSRWGRFFSHPSVRTATAAYITIVGIAYSLLLRHTWDPQGLQLLADRMLHDVTPVLYVLFWLLFVPKAKLHWRYLFAWLIYPAVYSVVALTRGTLFGWYPYPFINASKLGYPSVLLNVVLLFVAFGAVGAILIAIDRLSHRALRNKNSYS